MAQLKDLIVSGVSRFVGKLYASEIIGKLTGTADRAIADNNGNSIADTYMKDLSYSDGSFNITYGDDDTESFSMTGSGATTVTSNNGNITISSTDTHYSSSTAVASTNSGTSNAAASNGSVYINHVENGSVTSSHKISGSGAVSVTSDGNGDITVSVSGGSGYTFTGYTTCNTAADEVAKTATASGYNLVEGNIISIKFVNAVNANSTLNVSSTGAKNIFYQGIAITADIIQAGTTATFIYDGTQYQLIAMDSAVVDELDGGEEIIA